jgi:DNA-binding transcriptional regulator YiaG
MTPITLTAIRKASDHPTAKGFAEYLGISRETLRSYETGKRVIPMWLALAVTSIYHKFESLK